MEAHERPAGLDPGATFSRRRRMVPNVAVAMAVPFSSAPPSELIPGSSNVT
mgnify:CR=1 FL=1